MIEQTESTGRHAVVIGASMAGLLAARILADHFDRVTIVERDQLPKGPETRKGVPQAHHVHVLLARGQRLLEQFFPGLGTELAAAGATRVDWAADCGWYNFGGWKPRFPSGLITEVCSRALLEWQVRQRVAGLTNVRWMIGQDATGLAADESRSHVTGVRLRARSTPQAQAPLPANGDVLRADLVVNATGRDSRAAEWLASLGYSAPTETRVNSFLGYATRCYRRPEHRPDNWEVLIVNATPPRSSRGAVIVPLEGQRWLVTLAGAARDYPPTDEAGFVDFVRSLPTPVVGQAIAAAEPITPVVGYRRTENLRRHYEALPRYLEGLVTLGDAACALNPVYGQGMTVAAIGAQVLDGILREQRRRHPDGGLAGLAGRFQKALSRMTDIPWVLATGEDFRYATTEGSRPSLATRLLRPYLDRVLIDAAQNKHAHRAFLEVLHLIKPPNVLFRANVAGPLIWRRLARQSRNADWT